MYWNLAFLRLEVRGIFKYKDFFHEKCYFLEKILFQLGVTLQEYIGLSLMEEEVDKERLSQAFEETNKHFNEAFDISRYLYN